MHLTRIQLLVHKVDQHIAWLVEAQGHTLARQHTAECCQGFFYDCLLGTEYLSEEYRKIVIPTRVSLRSPQLEDALDELAMIMIELMDLYGKKHVAETYLLEMINQALLGEYQGCTLLKISARLL
jgi:hypothetical protein